MINLYIKSSLSYAKAALRLEENSYWKLSMAFLLAVVAMSMPGDVLAQATATTVGSVSDNSVAQVVCNIVTQLQGPVARGVAAFGIIFLGFSLFLGKISWGVALALGIGIGAIFGANEIVDLISGDGEGCGDA